MEGGLTDASLDFIATLWVKPFPAAMTASDPYISEHASCHVQAPPGSRTISNGRA